MEDDEALQEQEGEGGEVEKLEAGDGEDAGKGLGGLEDQGAGVHCQQGEQVTTGGGGEGRGGGGGCTLAGRTGRVSR